MLMFCMVTKVLELCQHVVLVTNISTMSSNELALSEESMWESHTESEGPSHLQQALAQNSLMDHQKHETQL